MVKAITTVLELLGILFISVGIGAIVWHYAGLPIGVVAVGALLLGASFVIARRGEG